MSTGREQRLAELAARIEAMTTCVNCQRQNRQPDRIHTVAFMAAVIQAGDRIVSAIRGPQQSGYYEHLTDKEIAVAACDLLDAVHQEFHASKPAAFDPPLSELFSGRKQGDENQ